MLVGPAIPALVSTASVGEGHMCFGRQSMSWHSVRLMRKSNSAHVRKSGNGTRRLV